MKTVIKISTNLQLSYFPYKYTQYNHIKNIYLLKIITLIDLTIKYKLIILSVFLYAKQILNSNTMNIKNILHNPYSTKIKL